MTNAQATNLLVGEPAASHESPEVDMPRTALSAVGLIATIVLCCVVSEWVFARHLKPIGERTATPMNGEGLVLPAMPRLEGIEMMSGPAEISPQAAAARQLQKYGWVDRDKRIVRVPVKRAMQLAIERNWLPSAAEPPKNDGTSPGPANSAPAPRQNTP